MKKHEKKAIETGELYDSSKPNPGDLQGNFPANHYGKVIDLVLPIIIINRCDVSCNVLDRL